MKRKEGDSEPFTMRLRAFAKLPVAEAFEDTTCLHPDDVRVLRVASATDRRHFSRYLAPSRWRLGDRSVPSEMLFTLV